MGVRTVGIVHDIPTPGNTGGHTLFHRLRSVLYRHFEVTERSFARGGPRASAVYYPFFPLARPVGAGLRARNDVVVTNLSGVFPVPGDFFYVQPAASPTLPPTSLLARLGFGRPPPPGLWPTPMNWLWYGRLVRPLLDAAGHDALDRTGTLVAVSGHIQRTISRELRREALVVLPSLGQDPFDALPRLAQNPRQPEVCAISRIDPNKYLEETVEVANRMSDVPFHIIGRLPTDGGAYLRRLERANAAGNVRFHPNCPEPEKRAIVGRSAAILQTSRDEPFGASIVEGALAGAVPVVHDSGGTPDLVDRENVYRTVDEAVEKLRLAIDSRSRVPDSLRDRLLAVADPARFEREIVAAVDVAYQQRRR